MFGEENFFKYLSVFELTKDKTIQNLEDSGASKDEIEQVKNQLLFYTNFQLVLETCRSDQYLQIGLETILMLLFPQFNVKIEEHFILLNNSKRTVVIDDTKWEIICTIVRQIFCIDIAESSASKFNPASDSAAAIAAKLEKRHQKLAEMSGGESNNSSSICNRVSVLSVGLKLNINEVMEYTFYQFFNQCKRFDMREAYNIMMKVRMFGGSKDEDEEMLDWGKSI